MLQPQVWLLTSHDPCYLLSFFVSDTPQVTCRIYVMLQQSDKYVESRAGARTLPKGLRLLPVTSPTYTADVRAQRIIAMPTVVCQAVARGP